MVTAFDKGRKRLVVFNDVLGRLPLLYHLAKDSLVVSQAIYTGSRLMATGGLQKRMNA